MRRLRDIYPTAKEEYGIETRRSENFHVNVAYLTLIAAVPSILVAGGLDFYYHSSLQSRTDVASHAIGIVVALILVGLVSLMFILRTRTVLRHNTSNHGLLFALFIIVFLPVSVAAANVIIQSPATIEGVPRIALSAAASLVLMFIFSVIVRVTNLSKS